MLRPAGKPAGHFFVCTIFMTAVFYSIEVNPAICISVVILDITKFNQYNNNNNLILYVWARTHDSNNRRTIVTRALNKPITHVYDGSLVIGNMLLAADSLGLGSIWIHRAKEEFEMDEWKDLLKSLGVEGEWEGIGHCAVGYVEGDKPAAAKRREGRVYWVE